MRYVVFGIVVGFVINIFLFPMKSGFHIAPKWHSDFSENLPVDNESSNIKDLISFKNGNSVFYYDAYGRLVKRFSDKGSLYAISGNGDFFAKYGKVGSEITFHSKDGAPFWKLHSREYPLISYNGKVLLLENGDQSALSVVDNNGNPIGEKRLYGRLCTVVAFSERGDFSAVGFADGYFYFLNEKGSVIYHGSIKNRGIVKGISISSNGRYGVVVSGNIKNDSLTVFDFKDNTIDTVGVGKATKTKNTVYISNIGDSYLLKDNFVYRFDSDGDLNLKIGIDRAKEGYGKFISIGNLMAISYPIKGVDSRVMIFNYEGEILFSKKFTKIPYLDIKKMDAMVIVRGTQDLFAYNLY